MKSLRIVVKNLDVEDTHYISKLHLMSQLIKEPNRGHIIPPEIVDWCKEQGLKPKCHHEDRTSWWTCSK